MESTNRKREFTDEQWDDLLNQTFVEPIPVPNTPPTPAPEPIEEVPPTPAPPVAKKRRKLTTKFKLCLGAFAVVFVAALCIFLHYRYAPTKELTQCMEALQQWQSTQYYKMTISTYYIGDTTRISHSSIRNERPTEDATYYQGKESMLYWCYSNNSNLNYYSDYYTGKAKIADEWFTYSSGQLTAAQWTSITDKTPTSIPWIMTYSLDDIQILHQDVQHEEIASLGKYTYITFAVMDTNRESPFYGQGPYHIRFFFQESQLYAIAHLQTDVRNTNLIATYFNLNALSAEDVATLIQMQIRNPQRYPGLSFDSTVQPIDPR